MESNDVDVLIVGAGIAGLTAAKILKKAGKSFKIIEASDRIGGRVKTDEVDGFLLDRGFQVLLTAYPEAQHLLDYEALELCAFDPGALILTKKGISTVGDPIRKPSSLIGTIFSAVGTIGDKLRLLKLRAYLGRKSINDIFLEEELTTVDYLNKRGFSEQMMTLFFKPFLSGIFLEDELKTSSRMFEFVFKMFAEGDAAIPAKGMEMIPLQLAKDFSPGDVICNEKVIEYGQKFVKTHTGSIYNANFVLIAADELNVTPAHQQILKGYQAVTNMYFSASKKPFNNPMIALNTSKRKWVNNIAVMNNISSRYANNGSALISLSLLGDYTHIIEADLQKKVIDELTSWYPDAVHWKHVKTYHIPYALPNDEKVFDDLDDHMFRLRDNCFVCGDYLLNGSINAAMKSGRKAAEAIIKDMI